MQAQLYTIEGPWPGRLAIVPRPRGGDWLEDEVRAWKTAGVNVVVSALEADETAELDLMTEAECCAATGIEWLAFPIPDRGLPASSQATGELAGVLSKRLAEGKTVAIHCRQSVGRSAVLAACVLVSGGVAAEVAFERICKARGCPVPDTPEQRQWVMRLPT
jgi:protein-tyrosine phosphatase